MITLSLLHPIKQIPVQVWTFENESTIRIGRSTDNQVILYSAVVSRHHVELRRIGNNWEIVNLGTNGTYLDGKRITQVPVADGAIIRLARSGPNIQIRIGAEALSEITRANNEERTAGQPAAPDQPTLSTEITDDRLEAEAAIAAQKQFAAQPMPVPPHLQLAPNCTTAIAKPDSYAASIAVVAKPEFATTPIVPFTTACAHKRGASLFCPDCGQPMQILQRVDDYCVLKLLGQGEVGMTYVAWRQGSTMVLKTLTPRWADNPRAWAALECEAGMLQQIQHPQIPRFIDFFSIGDQPYLAMEFFSGQSLAQRLLTGQAVALNQAIAWVSNLCEVLHYLHSFVPPLLHRGIKPSSLIPQPLPDRPDAIALVDFGTIKAIVLGERASSIGFAGYSAPEQLAVDATPAVDLYGLGALLAHLITGQNPLVFYGDRGAGYRFYGDAVPGIPPELASILQTLTHPNPEQRYGSAEAVRVALTQLGMS